MTGFVSPLADLGSWTLAPVPQVSIPKGLRYGGMVCRGLRAERAAPADVLMPAPGVLRKVAVPAGPTVVEIQVNPFRTRDLAGVLPFGLPTFYVLFDTVPSLAFDDDESKVEGAPLAAAGAVTLVLVGQDRIVRDPAEWAREIAAAIPNPDTGSTSWQAYASAIDAALAATRPILILDHRGQLAETTALCLVVGGATQDVDLAPADAGDLRAALRRMGLPDDPFASGAPVRLRQRSGDVQFARIEDRIAAAGEIPLTPSARHVQVNDLEAWFAPQFAVPEDAQASPLQRYTRGNRLTPFVNGRSFYRTFFDLLDNIDGAGQGVHLSGGFRLDAESGLRELGPEDDRPNSLKASLERIATVIPDVDSGGGRFLAAKFIQIEPQETLSQKEIAAFYFLVGIIGVANMAKIGLDGLKTDGSGFAILVLLGLLHHDLVNEFIDQNGVPLELMRDAVELLDDPDALRSFCKFSPVPSTVADNPLAPSGFPFDTLFPFIRHFGLYHQKIAVIRNRDGAFGFCGGIDLSTSRLDDADHNVGGPYHDVHAMVEGQAVVDVATTFAQRWARDGRDTNGAPLPPAFTPESTTPAPAVTGDDVVQVARTYPMVLDPATRLGFAPFGDRTISDTTLKAIAQAKEYIHIEDQYFTPPPDYVAAISDRVRNGLRRLVITLPTSGDQPYGEHSQTQAITAFKAAEADAGAAPGEIVKIGILRRHFTVPSNTLRAASGKLIVGEEMLPQPADPGFDDTIVLGPKVRAPSPPFWVAVEGELMWVFDEAPVVIHGEPPEGTRRYLVNRGQRTNLFGLGTGARPRNHGQGSAATVVDLKGIFVHAKLILIDDVFAGIGSANVNRRGFYSDGEGHFFWMPELLKAKPPPGSPRAHNPIARLRHELWAELLNLPYPAAAPLLDDPIAASALFDRSPIHGNRFTPREAIPQSLSLGTLNGGDSVIALVLQALFSTIVNMDHQAIFDGIVDPTTQLEPLA